MEERLIERLEMSVTRLEAVLGIKLASPAFWCGADDFSSEQSIKAFNDFMAEHLVRVLSTAKKIGGLVLDISKLVEEAFQAQKDLLVRVKQCQEK